MRIRESAITGAALALLLAAPLVTLRHVYLNDLRGVVVVIVLLLVTAVLYAAAMVPLALAAESLFWLRRRARRGAAVVPDERRAVSSAAAGWVLAALLPFVLLSALYGLTYEQTVLFAPTTWIGMVLYLGTAAAALTLVCWVSAVALTRWAAAVAREGRLLQIGGVVFALQLLVLVVSALVQPVPETRQNELAPGDLRLRDTELDVVLLALDGLDPGLVEEMIDAGELPTFARLRAQGVWAPLETLPDANSAVIWASIYTGRTPEAHSIHDFYRLDLPLVPPLFPAHRTAFKELAAPLQQFGLATRIPVERKDLATVPLWEIADYFGYTTGVIDAYLYSYPAFVPTTQGSWFLTYGLDTFVRMAKASGGIAAEEVGLYVQPPDLLPAEQLPEAEDFRWQWNALRELLTQREQPRLLSLYTHQPDALQHERWPEVEPEKFPPWQRPGDGEQQLRALHREFDRFLAEVTRLADPRSAFFVLSDHGHVATISHKLYSQHRHGPPGVLLAWGGAIAKGVTVEASVYDIAPTVLRLLGLPNAKDMPGRVLEEAIQRGFLQRTHGLSISSYDGLWKPRIQQVERSEAMRQSEIEKLKSMGYL